MLTSHTCERGVRAANTKTAASAADSMRAAAACSEVSRLLILAQREDVRTFPKRPPRDLQETPSSAADVYSLFLKIILIIVQYKYCSNVL